MSQILFPTDTTGVTPASGDIILIADVSDSNNPKDCTLAELPISTATQSALDLKANLVSPTLVTPVLGVATATSINGATITSGTLNGSVTGTNTGDQTITLTGAVTGSGTGSFATTIATPGTNTVSSTNSTATAHTHAITSSSAPGVAASILATDASGHIGSTGTRIVKLWATDITSTNAIAGSITGNAATVTTNANLTGHITSTGNAAVLGSFTKAQLNTAISDGDAMYLDSTDTITAVKTFSSAPVFNALPTGTAVASAATASTIATRDANGNMLADNFIEGFRTQATAAGTTTLVVGDTYTQEFTGVTTQTCVLPTTGIVAGQQFNIINNSTGLVTVQSSGANTILIMGAQTTAIFTALVATPTTAANWDVSYQGANVASGKVLTSSNTLTLAGTDGTTMTFPSTSATIARTDAANTFTGVQTMTSPSFTTPVLGTPTSGTLTNCTGYQEIKLATILPSTATDGATVTFDLSINNKHQVTIAGNRTLALSNTTNIPVFSINIKQDATGSRTVTWFSGISWVGGTVPTLTTTASKTDSFGFQQISAGVYLGFIIGQNI